MSSSRYSAAFEGLLVHTLADFSFDASIQAQMETAQRQLFDTSFSFWTEKLGVTLNKTCSDSAKALEEEARRILFFPVPSDMKIWAKGLTVARGKAVKGPQLKLMSLLYAMHSKSPPLLEALVAYTRKNLSCSKII